MSCYHPNLMIYIGNGSQFQFNDDGSVKRINRDWLMVKNTEENRKRYAGGCIEVPCGKCIGCRLDYSRTWANRCSVEAKQYKYNYFLTITYNDANVPIGYKGNYTLDPDDFTKFMKRLRKNFNVEYKKYCQVNNLKYENVNIRFFACGEYGEKTFRPHYHCILFNCPLFDLSEEFPVNEDGVEKKVKKFGSNGERLYYSKFLESVWNRGNIQVGNFSWQSCSYVARYVMKKAKGNTSAIYEKLGVVPEFLRMSRKPGIGRNYFEENREKIYDTHELILSNGDHVIVSAPPRYYDKLEKAYEEENGEVSLDLYKRRNIIIGRLRNDTTEAATDVDLNQARSRKESDHLDRVRILSRKL